MKLNGWTAAAGVCGIFAAGAATMYLATAKAGQGSGASVSAGRSVAPAVPEGNTRAGDVITIEPGLYSAEHGSVRLEDTITVTADGYRNLTNYPMDWRP